MVSVRRQRMARLAWALLLALAVVAVPVLNRRTSRSSRGDAGTATLPAATALSRYGFQLVEVGKASGVDFTHDGPTFDARLDHIMPQVASMGASVAVADFDRDGWLDFYVTTSAFGRANQLYRNTGDGQFVDVAPQMGVASLNDPESGVSMGSVWGDYDNDGFDDLLVYKYGRPVLFHNDAGVGFTPLGPQAGLPRWLNANSATWFDYDRDGRLDVFLAGYWREDVNLWKLSTTRIMPESFEYANNGGRKYLLRNRGDGTFEDVTAAAGITSRRWTLAVVAADLLGTGYPDLFFANDYGVSELYANQAGKGFVDVGQASGVGRSPKSGMNASLGDVFNDGRPAIYKSNISEPGVLVQGNDLWVPQPRKAGDAAGPARFENMASGLGIDLGGWSWGAQFGDLNNDGTQDLYLVNGYVSAGERSSYWYDFSVIAVGHSAIIGDARNWPAMRGRSLSGYQRKRVWLNDGLGTFTEVAQAIGVTDAFDGRAVALADFRNRGALDVVVANQRGPALLYRNSVDATRHWVDVELEGTVSNRGAVGARVELEWNGKVQRQDVVAASGFSAQNQRRVHFGLGAATRVDRLVITWPSGQRDILAAPDLDRVHRVREVRP